MRAVFALFIVAGCATTPPPKDDCDRATQLFLRCGVSLPLGPGQGCTGLRKIVSRCVVTIGGDCDALASLGSRLDECAQQVGDDLPPLEDPPLFSSDAGVDGGRSVVDGSVVDGGWPVVDGSSPSPDLAHPDLAAPDLLQPWVGLDESGSLALNATRSFHVAVTPGTYVFDLTGTGDVDLYVRLGKAPTTTLYDCRPFLDGSTESCTVAVPSLDIAYVTLRADVVASTFHLVANQE